MEWTNDKISKFIDLYRSESVIWDPLHKYHKDKNKVIEAWSRISHKMGDIPINVLKKKKEVLLVTFRLNHRKKLGNIGTQSNFKPSWIFYDRLAEFLAEIYECRTLNANFEHEESSHSTPQDILDPLNNDELPNSDNEYLIEASSPARKRQRMRSETPDYKPNPLIINSNETHNNSETILSTAMATVSNVIDHLNKNISENVDDECDMYGKLLAMRLRKLPYNERLQLMHEIDGLYLKRRGLT